MGFLQPFALGGVLVFAIFRPSWNDALMVYSSNDQGDIPPWVNPPSSNENAESSNASKFQDIELVKKIGEGDINYAFEARYNDRPVIAKIASDRDIFWMDNEIDIFHELNRPPTIPNIPKLHLGIRSMPNPFTDVSYLEGLGLKKRDAKELTMKRRISVMVMDRLENNRKTKDIFETRRMMKSLLETLRFVHSRNIIHGDLHSKNVFWDGERASIFDWNGAFRYEQDQPLLIHYPNTAKHLYPPEAKHKKKAVHTSVHAFDVYTVGILLKKRLKKFHVTKKRIKKKRAKHTRDEVSAFRLAEYLMAKDPTKRPDTNLALQHPFFSKS